MNIGKRKMMFLILCGLFVAPVISCSAMKSLGVGSSGSSDRVVVSELVTVELGKVLMFDERKYIVGIAAIVNPGRSAEVGKRYKITISWKGKKVGDGSAEFKSLKTVRFDSRGELDPREVRNALITLEGELAKQYINLLTQIPEYKRLQKELENLQEEKRKLQDREDEMKYNLFWKGEAPSYEQAKKVAAQMRDLDVKVKEITQAIHELPLSGVFPQLFVNSLELVVEAKAAPTPVATPIQSRPR